MNDARGLDDITAVDGLFPAALLRTLRAQVIAMEKPKYKALRWFDLSAKPRTLFEQVIAALRAHVPGNAADAGAEWWMRSQPSHTGFKFHFDRDEAIATNVVSPRRSSILYLSETGGPTLMMDVKPTDETFPAQGLAVHPRPGRFMTFPGTLLHGVLPDGRSRWPRVAMFINWWIERPRSAADEASRSFRRLSPAAPRVVAGTPKRPREAPIAFAAKDLMTAADWKRIVDCEARTLARMPSGPGPF
jgi:hypothetical protein